MFGCRSCNFSCEYCMGPDKQYNEKFSINENKLLYSIENYIKLKKDKRVAFSIWGGEPLFHFNELKQTILFLRKNYPNCKIIFSTNGFLLSNKEYQEFILQNHIKLQLSHDGVGQIFRSNFNPLDNHNISLFLTKLIKTNQLTINCVMHNKNPSVSNNIKYFSNWMTKYKCMNSTLNIRFTPFNESCLTSSFNFSKESLKTFIDEYEQLYIYGLFGKKRNKLLNHFIKYPLKIIKKANFEKCNWEDSNSCAKFYSGKSETSNHIDTKGNYLSCNLIDSGIQPRGKTIKKIPTYCEKCEFKMTRGCWPCPAGDFTEKCEYKKEWMNFQRRMILLKELSNKT